MLRVTWTVLGPSPRMMTESELIDVLADHARVSFMNVAGEPLLIEAFDEQQRLCWRGHYKTPRALHDLLDQLELERELARRVKP